MSLLQTWFELDPLHYLFMQIYCIEKLIHIKLLKTPPVYTLYTFLEDKINHSTYKSYFYLFGKSIKYEIRYMYHLEKDRHFHFRYLNKICKLTPGKVQDTSYKNVWMQCKKIRECVYMYINWQINVKRLRRDSISSVVVCIHRSYEMKIPSGCQYMYMYMNNHTMSNWV